MSTPEITPERQSQLLSRLEVLAAERAQTERTLHSNRVARQNTANSSYHTLREQELRSYQDEHARLERTQNRELAEAQRVYQAAVAELEEEETRFERLAPRQHQEALNTAQRRRESGKLRSEKQHAKSLQSLKKQWIAFEEGCNSVRSQYEQLQRDARLEARRRRLPAVAQQPAAGESGEPAAAAGGSDRQPPLVAAREALQEVEDQLARLARPAARFFDEHWTVLLLLFSGLFAIYPAGSVLGWSSWHWAAAAVAAAIAVTVAARLLAGWSVRRHAANALPRVFAALARAQQGLRDAWAQATVEAETKRADLDAQLYRHGQQIDSRCAEEQRGLQAQHDQHVQQTQQRFAARRRELSDGYQHKLEEIRSQFSPAIQRHSDAHQKRMAQLQQDNRAELQRSQRAYDDGMQQLVARWTAGLSEFLSAVGEMNDYCDRRFPPWGQIDWQQWQPSKDVACAFPYGHFLVDIDQFGEAPEDPRLTIDEPRCRLPAVLAFPQRPSLLLEASDEGKQQAVATMQTLMLRLLMSAPPGKVRFTIVDPEALGQNFSVFMHLSDFDEQLVGPRIWTESSHIQQQLTDLTEHTENVIQKYLRNEFESIQQYNERAGEVAEPYRILVVANFPENFTEEAARRLVSIASSGPRCGVFTLISVDTRKKLPRDFYLDELETHATTLQWTYNGFRPKEPQLRALPLIMDSPPGEADFTRAIREVGRHAREADRVEVPFDVVAPSDEQCWSLDSRRELEVALGRAGATKLQYMRLGKGVSQHVLISGKTGSGKSTLLHALITNVSLHYSPEEVEFYLIDFKKGVEFKPYAAGRLPHARVIAIESEREFGLSVLQRLDEELRRRGDIFRSAGVQDIAGFRNAHPEQTMPRVLLIIDEFQELFVKDDKIASESGLLLDRLVRQGRAFGMHVLLGSQTLAGAYSLARSTIGQMAVRIALQCSESDAHLILSEDNTAARLLSRPGEAIYNNANGRFEGNNPFQVVFLSEGERVEQLRRIARLAERRGSAPAEPIVFEGNVPADPAGNPDLRAAIEGSGPAAAAPRIWLGAAVAIKPPTYTEFHRHNGAHLLVVGPQEEMALGVLGNAALALSAQGCHVSVLDGCRNDSSEAGKWRRLSDSVPGDIAVADPKQSAPLLAQVAAELDRRQREQDEAAPAHFVVVHNLARFRDLRRAEQDFSFSTFSDESDGESESPDKLLQRLLRDGPPWGIHLLIWSDSFNTASRWLDRSHLKDIEQRVLFQMTAADSANLMDSPAASQLGVHRAILYTEEQGQQEKFRPYASPTAAWLATVSQCWQTQASSPPTVRAGERLGDGSS